LFSKKYLRGDKKVKSEKIDYNKLLWQERQKAEPDPKKIDFYKFKLGRTDNGSEHIF